MLKYNSDPIGTMVYSNIDYLTQNMVFTVPLARLYPLLSRRGHSGSDKGFKPLVQEYRYLL